MKIAIVTDWYSENMGYIENCLPKSLAALGHEVHVLSTNAQVYYNEPFYNKTYSHYLGPALLGCGSKLIDGYTLHRLPIGSFRGRIIIRGIVKKLIEIRPDIVQTFDAASATTMQCALGKLLRRQLDFSIYF